MKIFKHLGIYGCALLMSGCFFATHPGIQRPLDPSNNKDPQKWPQESKEKQDLSAKIFIDLGGYPKEWDELPQIMEEKTKSSKECQSDSNDTLHKTKANLEAIKATLDPLDLSTVLSQLPTCERDPKTGWITGTCKEILDRYFSEIDFTKMENQKYFTRILEYDTAKLLADYFRIKTTPSFEYQNKVEQLKQFNIMFFELSKLPLAVKEFLAKQTESLLDPVVDNINSHPEMKKGDILPVAMTGEALGASLGYSARTPELTKTLATIVVSNKLVRPPKFKGSDVHNLDTSNNSTILHEIGHTFQRHMEVTHPELKLKWAKLPISNAAENWLLKNINGEMTGEGFADSFASYFHSEHTREYLQKYQPEIYNFIKSLVES